MRATALLLVSASLLLAATTFAPSAAAVRCAIADPGVGPIGTQTVQYADTVCNATLVYAQALCNDAVNPLGFGCVLA